MPAKVTDADAFQICPPATAADHAYDAGYADAMAAVAAWQPGNHAPDCRCPACGIAARAVAYAPIRAANAGFDAHISIIRAAVKMTFAACPEWGKSPYDAIWELVHAATDSALESAALHPDGDATDDGIAAAVSAAIAAAGDYDSDNAGLAARAAFD